MKLLILFNNNRLFITKKKNSHTFSFKCDIHLFLIINIIEKKYLKIKAHFYISRHVYYFSPNTPPY